MDEDVSRWIIDFLLRQPLHDRIIDKLLSVLPFSIHDSSLKKSILVRKIVSEISKGLASEEMLILMERIEELDYQAGVTASEAIKAAYCDVAVDCTVKLLEESQDRAKYFNAVKRIWRGRVLKMEMAGNVGLISDELLNWRDDIETSVWNSSVDEDLLKKWRGCEALESVKVYVEEAWADMGPSFLEHVVQTVGNEQITQVLKQSTCPVYDQDLSSDEVQSSSAEMEKRSRGAKISDSDSQDGRAASENGFTFTPEVKKMQKALRDSCRDLQAVVVDPLPEAIQLADKIISNLPVNNLNSSCPMDVENLSTAKSDEAIGVNETQNNISRKPGLMERNSTARVHEWDESLDDAVDGSSDRNRLHLPSPSKRRVSPLKILEMKNLGKRKKRRWSIVEEDTLRAGVEKYGKGNWKFILNAYRDILVQRTEVDLKDKWRNMTRY
ncbi:uncharacterized protein LOC124915199 isoform X2 [Impatiens glandulifera]|uniref:uncharacterized protein LOC124915199 isoform X2 n=1 Tax=Impatiens glandulifera TaxID=253017 RepID=UPI001FB0B219|nr:uncharacterized protein LOC124915199 isoform X2 [Impatiens glandulifera]